MKAQVQIGRRGIGDGAPCFITFEAGPTHDSLDSAKRLASLAARAGADAVKFQVLDADRLVADRNQPFSYAVLVDRDTGRTETVVEPLYDILVRRMLSVGEWHDLKRHCDEIDIAFFATACFDDEVDMLAELECPSIKIASADVNHYPLIRRAARTGMVLQVDTGNATIGEIERAVEIIRSEGNERIIIHQCPSGYPARLDSINLRIIPTLKRMFGFPVAYSDHTPGRDMDIAAVAMGANLVEKTITEDRTIRSTEHMFSLEPGEMAEFVQAIRDVERAFGSPRRIMHPEEVVRRNAIRRSVFLPEGGAEGARLGDVPVEFRRPGDGIQPDMFETLTDRTLRRDLAPGTKLSMGDLA